MEYTSQSAAADRIFGFRLVIHKAKKRNSYHICEIKLQGTIQYIGAPPLSPYGRPVNSGGYCRVFGWNPEDVYFSAYPSIYVLRCRGLFFYQFESVEIVEFCT